MLYRFSQNTFDCKSVVFEDFRIDVFGAERLDVDFWAPFNVFGFVAESESTQTTIRSGEMSDSKTALPKDTFTLFPACTETSISESGRVEWVCAMFRPLFCCGVSYNFPSEPVMRQESHSISMIVRGLMDTISRREFSDSAAIPLKVASLLRAISDFTTPRDPVRKGLPSDDLSRVVELIEANLADNLPNDRLSKHVELSVDTFRRKFHESTGLPTHQYIARARAARARRLIEEGGLTLAEVSLEAGYCSQSHMSRMFLETFGVSPGRFKRMRSMSQ